MTTTTTCDLLEIVHQPFRSRSATSTHMLVVVLTDEFGSSQLKTIDNANDIRGQVHFLL